MKDYSLRENPRIEPIQFLTECFKTNSKTFLNNSSLNKSKYVLYVGFLAQKEISLTSKILYFMVLYLLEQTDVSKFVSFEIF